MVFFSVQSAYQEAISLHCKFLWNGKCMHIGALAITAIAARQL